MNIKPKLKRKSTLAPAVQKLMLSKQEYIGMLADEMGTSVYTVQRQLVKNAPILCQTHYISAISRILAAKETAAFAQIKELVLTEDIATETYLHQ